MSRRDPWSDDLAVTKFEKVLAGVAIVALFVVGLVWAVL